MDKQDQQLVEKAQRGDLQAFSEVVALHRRIAFAVAFARLGDAEDAHDAVQEAFIDAFLSLPQLQDADKFRAWLTTILTRRCARMLAERRKQAALHSLAQNQMPTEETPPGKLRTRRCLIGFHPVTVISLRSSVLDGYSYAEIATRMHLPITTVRSRIHRARVRLYQEVFPMSDANTLFLTREVMERLLIRLTTIEHPCSPEELQQSTERTPDGDIAAITNGLAWLLEHGESLERAFLLTCSLPPGLCSLLRFGRETERSEMMFRVAASLLKVGLLQPDSPVGAAEAASFFAYFTCMLQAGVPILQAMKEAGQHVNSLAAVATDIADAWLSHQSMATALGRHGHIFTEPCISILLFAENTGLLDTISAFLAALFWKPEMLNFSDFKGLVGGAHAACRIDHAGTRSVQGITCRYLSGRARA